MISNGKPILDACCGGRMFWFDKDNPLVDFMDNRVEDCCLCDGRKFTVKPDIIGDFTDMPFPSKSYKLVVFDPPHLVRIGSESYMAKKYGKLSAGWEKDLRNGFNECMRVLDDFGVLVFKWSEVQIKISQVLNAIGQKPLFGHRTNQNTLWMCFMKIPTI